MEHPVEEQKESPPVKKQSTKKSLSKAPSVASSTKTTPAVTKQKTKEFKEISVLTGVLKVVIGSAKLKRDVDTFGKQDPYVRLHLYDQFWDWKSKVVESGGKEPTWNETVEIPIKRQDQDLTIKVMDDDLGDAKEMVCGANIKVETLCVSGGFSEDIQLDFKGKDAGTITIKADFVPDKSPEKKASNKIGASESGTTPVMRQSTKSKVSNEGQLTKKLTQKESSHDPGPNLKVWLESTSAFNLKCDPKMKRSC